MPLQLASRDSNDDDALHDRLTQHYLLAISVPFMRDPEGHIWLDDLWWQDLRLHLDYIEDLTVLAPWREIATPGPGLVEAVAPEGTRLSFVGTFPAGGLPRLLSHLGTAIRTTWKAGGRADLVHSGVAGWPIPIGALVNPMAVLRHKPLIIVVESAFWRVPKGQSGGWKTRLRAWLSERFAHWSLRHAALGIYTHAGYRATLPVGPDGTGVVLPASWISDRDIIPAAAARQSWEAKPQPPRFLLASRLVPQKGIPLFLEAMRCLERQGVAVDVIGSGDMRAEIEDLARQAKAVHLRLLDPIPYGPGFMQLLRDYHATLVPLTGDEQARILYDSFSQAVPAIATDTPGNREVVTDGKTGILFDPRSPEAFASALSGIVQEPDTLRRMGMESLAVASGYSHSDMHRKRADLLRTLFGTGARDAGGISH